MARSRDELAAIIRMGEAVLMPDGRVITSLDELPSAVELAGNDIVTAQFAVKQLEDEAKAKREEFLAAQAAVAELSKANAPAEVAAPEAKQEVPVRK